MADKYINEPHTDESGPSRAVHISSVIDDTGTGGRTFIMLTPKEEEDYNDGMARMAEWG